MQRKIVRNMEAKIYKPKEAAIINAQTATTGDGTDIEAITLRMAKGCHRRALADRRYVCTSLLSPKIF